MVNEDGFENYIFDASVLSFEINSEERHRRATRIDATRFQVKYFPIRETTPGTIFPIFRINNFLRHISGYFEIINVC